MKKSNSAEYDSDCLIVGAGLIGLLTAWELVARGMTVTILDHKKPGNQCSWAGGGILSQLYPWKENSALRDLVSLSQSLYPELAATLISESGIDPELRQSGMLVMDMDEAEAARHWADKNNIELEVLQGKQVANIEPALTSNTQDALWFPDVAQIRNPRLLKALKFSLSGSGVQFHENTEVKKLLIENSRVHGVASDKDIIQADKVVIASGAWSSELLKQHSFKLAIKPVRGQMISFQLPENKLKRIILNNSHYIIPRKDGLALVGSTLEEVGFANETSTEALDKLRSEADKLLPSINEFPLLNHWSGLRPASPEEIPVIDSCPDIEGLFLNTGHYRNGILLAPASARLLANIICGEPECIEKKHFEWPQ